METEVVPAEPIMAALQKHEARSESRYQNLKADILGVKTHKGDSEMSIEDRVNIHTGSNDNGLLAAALLGNRGNMPMGDGLFGGMGGGGIIGGLVLGALLGNNRNGGLFGGGNNGGGCWEGGISPGQAAFDQTILTGVTGLTAAVPNAALQTQNAILAQTNELSTQINASQIAQLQASSAVKDSVQNSLAILLNQGSQNTNMVLAAVQGVKDQASAYRIADLEQKLTVAQLDSRDQGLHRRLDSVEVNVAQTVNQNQVQGQIQAQLQAQGFALAHIAGACNEGNQIARATNQNLIVGNAGAVATGPQTANPVNVRA